MKKIIKEEEVVSTEKTRKEILLDLYKTLQEEGIRSVGDLENKIANEK